MCKLAIALAGLALWAASAGAQTADEIVAKYVARRSAGWRRFEAIQTLRTHRQVHRRRRLRGEGRRREQAPQPGASGVPDSGHDRASRPTTAKAGWKIEPWQGKKDAEPLGEEELKHDPRGLRLRRRRSSTTRQKGIKVEYAGTEPVEGTDAYKLKVTLANGDVRYYYMDTDYFVPIKIETKRMIRGAERESETMLGDYKEVARRLPPPLIESGVKGSPNKVEGHLRQDRGQRADRRMPFHHAGQGAGQ